MAVKRYPLQLSGSLSEACIAARASFLDSILHLRVNVVRDLWNTAQLEFKLLVMRSFFREIVTGLDLETYLEERRQKFAREPRTTGDYFTDLIQQKLSPFQSVWSVQADPVREAFFDYRSAAETRENQPLLAKIDLWSKRWNLDADWCRDHALAVLRAWLFDNDLKWVDIYPHCLRTVQQRGWRSAVSDLESHSCMFSVMVELSLDSLPATAFQFIPRNKDSILNFEASWNPVKETEEEFKRRVRLDFRMSVLNSELVRLQSLQRLEQEGEGLGAKEFESQLAWRDVAGASGAMQEFERQLKEYVTTINLWRDQAKAKHHLAEGVLQPRTEHLRWLILYQVPDLDGNSLRYSEIADAAYLLTLLIWCLKRFPNVANEFRFTLSFLYSQASQEAAFTSESMRKSIRAAAKLIDLPPRNPHLHGGRPPESGKPLAFRVTSQKIRN